MQEKFFLTAKGKDTTTETVGNEKVTIGTNPTTGHKVYVKKMMVL